MGRIIVMANWVTLFIVTFGVAVGAFGNTAWAGNSNSDHWEVVVAPYVWAVSLNGDVTVRGRTAKVDASFRDILKSSDSIFAFQGIVEARKGKWAVFVDGTYMALEAKTGTVGLVSVDTTTQLALVEFGALYRLREYSLAEAPGGSLANKDQKVVVDFLAGARYMNLDAEIDLIAGPFSPSPGRIVSGGSKDWVDAVVGLRSIIDVTQKVQLLVRGDIGGFNGGSDLTWKAQGLLGYQFTLFDRKAEVWGGYRALYQDFTDGTGVRTFEWNMLLHGPLTGLSIKF